eukprot:207753-Ditylum_brightwellii.AAC.1
MRMESLMQKSKREITNLEQSCDVSKCKANWKKMIECNIEDEQYFYAMQPRVLDILTVIPVNEIFPTAHPNLPAFVTALKQDSCCVVTKIENVRNRRTLLPTYQDLALFEVPGDYFAFDKDVGENVAVA